MLHKQSSLEQHAKQSHSISLNQIHYSDYIDQQVKQNQITPFSSLDPTSHQKTRLRELNSNQQNQRGITSVDKSHIETGEIKLYRERVQTLENRLKEKNSQLKLKQDQINRLYTQNEELENFKVQYFLLSSQKCPKSLFKNSLEHQQHKQVQTNSQEKTILKDSTNLKVQQQLIELRFELQKYQKKYLIIQQNLKKRVNQYENQITLLNRKLKQEKQQTSNLQQEIFSLQEENIDLKQKLQEAFQQIESFEMQREEISREMPAFDINHLQNNGRRFSFGDDFKEVAPINFTKESKHVFLSIFNQVSFSFVPEMNQQTGRFKCQQINKRNPFTIRLYPRMYEIKVLGHMKKNNFLDLEEGNKQKFMDIGCNTVQKRLRMAACVNIKISSPFNDGLRKGKQTKKLRICSREVTFNPAILMSTQSKGISRESNKIQRYGQNLGVHETEIGYKQNSRNRSPNLERNQLENFYERRSLQRTNNYENYACRFQSKQKTQRQDSLPPFRNLNNVNKPQLSRLSLKKDITQRINHHLKNSNLIRPKDQQFGQFYRKKQTEPQVTRYRPINNQVQNSIARREQNHTRPTVSHQKTPSTQTVQLRRPNNYSDWVVEQIHHETNQILSKYIPTQESEITYHQSYPRTYHTQTIEKPQDISIKRSSSIQNLQLQKTFSSLPNDKKIVRNMSLSSLDHIKLRDSFSKHNNLRLNTAVDHKQSVHLNKTQDIKEAAIALLPITPLRQKSQKVNPSISMKDLIAQKCKKLSIN